MKRLIITFVCSYCIFFFTLNNVSGDSRYIIEDVLIQIDSSNTVNIRNNAIIKAQHVAYKRMILPIIHPDEYNKIFPIDSVILNSLVSGVELKEELILKDKYKANFKINFNSIKVQEFFKKNSVLYSVTESKPISLIPIIYSKTNQINLEKIWNSAWNEVNNNNKDIFNLNIITRISLNNPMLTIEDFLSLSLNEEQSVKNINNNIFIWANFFIDQKGTRKMNIITKSIFNKKTHTITKSYTSLSGESDFEFINKSVRILRQDLFNLWIEYTSSLDTTIPYKIRFTGDQLKAWSLIEAKLLNIESIKKIIINYLDAETLKGTLYFSGDLNKLKLILLENDILLTYLGNYSDISFISE